MCSLIEHTARLRRVSINFFPEHGRFSPSSGLRSITRDHSREISIADWISDIARSRRDGDYERIKKSREIGSLLDSDLVAETSSPSRVNFFFLDRFDRLRNT
jgi:hypothetical protein